MFHGIPRALLDALTNDERDALGRLLAAIGVELASVYADEVEDHRESRGDNGQLFGMKIWTHGWFRYAELFAEDPVIEIVASNGSYAVHVGRLQIGIYRQGTHADDDVHHNVPDESETKRSYGEVNAAQLVLFDSDLARPTVLEDSYGSLLALTLSHFGNSRDGLVKWYVGAQSAPGRWAWVSRMPDADADSRPDTDTGTEGMAGTVVPFPPRPSQGGPGEAITPFSEQPVEDVEVHPRGRPGPGREDAVE